MSSTRRRLSKEPTTSRPREPLSNGANQMHITSGTFLLKAGSLPRPTVTLFPAGAISVVSDGQGHLSITQTDDFYLWSRIAAW